LVIDIALEKSKSAFQQIDSPQIWGYLRCPWGPVSALVSALVTRCVRNPVVMTGLAAMARCLPRKGELQRMKFAQPRAFGIRHIGGGGDRRSGKSPFNLLNF
jgi:hypothetical protein